MMLHQNARSSQQLAKPAVVVSPVLPVVAPVTPAQPFDLLAHLALRATQRHEGICEKDFSFYSLPVHIVENVQHLAERFKSTTGNRTTENDVIDILVLHGLDLIEADPDIRLWRTLRESVIGIEPSAWHDTEDYELVRLLMDDLKMGLNPCGREPRRKRNVKLMAGTVERTSKLASSIGFGMSVNLVGILLLMRGQTALSKDEVFNHDPMQADLERFIAKLRKRTSILSHTLAISDVEMGEDIRAILNQCGSPQPGPWRADAPLLPVTGEVPSLPVAGRLQILPAAGVEGWRGNR